MIPKYRSSAPCYGKARVSPVEAAMLSRVSSVLLVSFFLVLVNTTSALAEEPPVDTTPAAASSPLVLINGERVVDAVDLLKVATQTQGFEPIVLLEHTITEKNDPIDRAYTVLTTVITAQRMVEWDETKHIFREPLAASDATRAREKQIALTQARTHAFAMLERVSPSATLPSIARFVLNGKEITDPIERLRIQLLASHVTENILYFETTTEETALGDDESGYREIASYTSIITPTRIVEFVSSDDPRDAWRPSEEGPSAPQRTFDRVVRSSQERALRLLGIAPQATATNEEMPASSIPTPEENSKH